MPFRLVKKYNGFLRINTILTEIHIRAFSVVYIEVELGVSFWHRIDIEIIEVLWLHAS